jgi:prephenate dehydratase
MKIAFQGIAGAYSDVVCHALFPGANTLPCVAFEDVFAAVTSREADRAVIPVENSVAGRVADVHHLLPKSGLFIEAEHFEKITHHLLAVPGASLETVQTVYSHVQGLSQCRTYLRDRGYTPAVHSDTAGAAREVALRKSPHDAAIASTLAASIYGLEILASDIADEAHNTTRFLVLGREAAVPNLPTTPAMTTLYFTLRSVPAALYKALGGFATNGINLTKIESYMSGGAFHAAEFYVDCAAHAHSEAMQYALEELRFYSKDVRILGIYPQAAPRV